MLNLFTLYLISESWTSGTAGDVDEEKEKETEKEYRLLCDWMKQNLGDKVAKVTVSKRISSSPCVLVSGKFGWSANMERYGSAHVESSLNTAELDVDI